MNIPWTIRQAIKKRMPDQVRHAVKTSIYRRRMEPELALALTLAGQGMFIDVGANEGMWSAAAAKKYKRVVSFEPDRGLCMHLRKVLPANVTVYGIALSDRRGDAQLLTPLLDGAPLESRSSLNQTANGNVRCLERVVACAPLDDFGFAGVDVVKIDVEGHEAAVLEGSRALIERERPYLIVEIEERHHPGKSDAIISGFASKDYGCFYLEAGSLVPLESKSVAELQPPARRVDGVPINNFIFCPKEKVPQLHSAASAAHISVCAQ
jgi:FkbM family methyltransferase